MSSRCSRGEPTCHSVVIVAADYDSSVTFDYEPLNHSQVVGIPPLKKGGRGDLRPAEYENPPRQLLHALLFIRCALALRGSGPPASMQSSIPLFTRKGYARWVPRCCTVTLWQSKGEVEPLTYLPENGLEACSIMS